MSQEDTLVSGYWDNAKDVFRISHPIIIFGDHTRILKYIDFDFVVGADGVKILSPHSAIHPKFLFYYLRWYNIPSLGYSRHYKLLKDIEVPLPSIVEQHRIVAELDLLSGIIDKQKAQLRELDHLAQSIFYDMFGDPVKNEKNWKTEALKSVAPQKEYCGTVPTKCGKVWLLNLDMVAQQTGEIIKKTYVDSSEIGNSTIIFDSTNVLYSKLRPYLNKVALPDDIGFGTSELVPLKPKQDILNRVFLTYLLRSKPFVDYISIKVAGAKMPRVSMDILRDFPIILPMLEAQESFAKKIVAIELQKSTIQQSIVESQKLFDYTMDKYFGS